MKCPKCGYLGYERVDRCRNCGYEFSLSSMPAAQQAADLRLRDTGEMPVLLADLNLSPDAPPAAAGRFERGRTQPESAAGAADLPLFSEETDDTPLIRRPSTPRAPLSVRRATPEVPRLRHESRAPMLDWSEPTPSGGPASSRHTPQPTPVAAWRRARPVAEPVAPAPPAEEPASIRARALAAALDVTLLACLDLLVVYFTVKICRLSLGDVMLLPKGPLLAFLGLQNVGYFIAFTASGQTLGKMIAGVRVLASDSDETPDVGRAALRAFMWAVLALPAGLGLFAASFSRDGRGLHDRFAGTRVVRADA